MIKQFFIGSDGVLRQKIVLVLIYGVIIIALSLVDSGVVFRDQLILQLGSILSDLPPSSVEP